MTITAPSTVRVGLGFDLQTDDRDAARARAEERLWAWLAAATPAVLVARRDKARDALNAAAVLYAGTGDRPPGAWRLAHLACCIDDELRHRGLDGLVWA